MRTPTRRRITDQSGSQIAITIKDGKLIISIGVALLAHAVQNAPDWPMDMYISDIRAFAKTIAHALEQEEEDGTTPVHRMLDGAAEWAIEQGEDGVEDGSVDQGIALAGAAMEAAKAGGGAA